LKENKDKAPLITPILRWFLFTMVLANIAAETFSLYIPLYLTELGASIGDVGFVFTIVSTVILLLQIVGGWISDSIGRLKSIAIGSIGGILGYIAMLLAPTWQWMLLAIIISRFPSALIGPSFGAFIAENSTEENRGKVYGITDTIFQITGVVGPPLGGLLAGAYGFKRMLIVPAVMYTVAAGFRIWMASTMRSAHEAPPKPLSLTSFRTTLKTMFTLILGGGILSWILITDGVRDIAFRLSSELEPLYLERVGGISLEQIGLLGSTFSIAMMFTPILSGRIADRYGERVPISIGFALVSLGYFTLLQSEVYLGFVLAWVIFGIGVGLLSPAYQSLISKVVPKDLLGTFTGLFRSSLGLISLPAPWVGAQLWERFSPRLPFSLTALVSLLTIIPTWSKFKLTSSPEAEFTDLKTEIPPLSSDDDLV
jgi:MFS family permease